MQRNKFTIIVTSVVLECHVVNYLLAPASFWEMEKEMEISLDAELAIG